MHSSLVVGLLCLGSASLVGCNSGSHEKGAEPDATAANENDEPEDAAASDADSESQVDADDDPVGADDSAVALSGEDAGTDAGSFVLLPAGSRLVGNVANLVHEQAANALERFFVAPSAPPPTEPATLNVPTNLFLELYRDEYDFVYFFPDHAITNSRVAGQFVTVYQRGERGGGREVEFRAQGVRASERLKGAIAVNFQEGAYGPLAHEALHAWANHLDPSFGFGASLNTNQGPHWGFSSVAGELGGFDGSTLRCVDPANAVPPACNALPTGRFRYRVGSFFPTGSSRQAYAPLELYLMGILPSSEVTKSFLLLKDAVKVESSFDRTNNTEEVEASGVHELQFSDIVARHGGVKLLGEKDRSFRAAFVVLSKAPAPESAMRDIARRARAFAGEEMVDGMPSFKAFTGGRATMDVQLGPRRELADPSPPFADKVKCTALAQDCPRPDLGCYVYGEQLCAATGNVPINQPCKQLFECAPGLDCVRGSTASSPTVCRPYCNATETSSAKACQALCPGAFFQFSDPTGARHALCRPL